MADAEKAIMKTSVKIFFYKNARLTFAVALFLAIGLHTTRFDHDHQKEIFGSGAQAILHGSDKKHFFVPDAPNPGVFSVVFQSLFFAASLVIFSFSFFLLRRIHDPFREAIRRGIIHPKLYA